MEVRTRTLPLRKSGRAERWTRGEDRVGEAGWWVRAWW